MFTPVVQTNPPIEVVVDDDVRFQRVVVNTLDDGLRGVTTLVKAFDEAFSAAIGERADVAAEAAARRGAGRERRTPAGPVLQEFPSRPDVRGRQPRWDLIEAGARAARSDVALQPEGASANDCVHVRLDPASSRGRLAFVDSGWLSRVSASALAGAINEAFEAAYDARYDVRRT